jgi:phage minor structural protein
MSVYKAVLDAVSLDSHWTCSKVVNASKPAGNWVITSGPNEASASLVFPVEIPAGAIIARAWIALNAASSPIGGIAYFRANGDDVPSSGEVDIDVLPSDTSYSMTLTYKSWGVVYSDANDHYGRLIIEPVLYVDYIASGNDAPLPDVDGATASGATELRLPRLLDSTMKERARLKCKSLAINLKLDPLSTATVTISDRQPGIATGDYMEVFSPYGSAGIFRVHRVETEIEAGKMTQRCEMRHGISSLADDVVEEGNAISAPIAQLFSSIFAMQTNPIWVLGVCEAPADLEMVLERNFQSLFTAFGDSTRKLPDGYAWDFDQTALPWRANLRKMPEENACEFRLTRNVEGVSITVDRDSQCTRVYAFGAGEGEERIGLKSLIGTPYLDADNISDVGVKAKKIANEDIYDALALRDVAQRYLDRHKEPDVSIRVGGVDLHKLTGLSFDQFHLGKVCQVALPEFGMTVREKVVAISWRDVINKPDSVVADLNNSLRTPADEIAELMREATDGKLIGGVVNEETTEYNNSNVTQSSSLEHHFDITGYGNTLSVRVKFKPAGQCRLNVDGVVDVPADEAESGSVDILKYLKHDENGVPLVGGHYVNFFKIGTGTIAVNSKITVKTIEKR